MPIKIRCACGNVILAPEERVGQTGQCPSCNRAITVVLPPTDAAHIGAQTGVGLARAKKPLFITRFLGWGIYLLFFLLVAGLTILHCASPDAIRNFCPIKRPLWLKDSWQTHRETLIEIREEHQKMYQWVIGKYRLSRGAEKREGEKRDEDARPHSRGTLSDSAKPLPNVPAGGDGRAEKEGTSTSPEPEHDLRATEDGNVQRPEDTSSPEESPSPPEDGTSPPENGREMEREGQ